MSISAACQETIWLRRLIGEITPKLVTKETVIKNDNQSAIKLAYSTAYRARSKHIETRYHFIREKISEKIISLEYLNTKEMIADSLTKPVFFEKNELCCHGMGLFEL